MRQGDIFSGEEYFNQALPQRTEELYRVQDAMPDERGRIQCPAILLRDMVIFPHMISPIIFQEVRDARAIEMSQLEGQTLIGLIPRDPSLENPSLEDVLPIGLEIAVGRVLDMPGGFKSALAQSRRRVIVEQFIELEPYYVVQASQVYETAYVDREVKALMRSVLGLYERCVRMNRTLPEESFLYALNIDDPGWLADLIAMALSSPSETSYQLLTITDPVSRLKLVSDLLMDEIAMLELEEEINSKVKREIDRSQREMFLRERMRAIQSELGEEGVWGEELAELRGRIEAAQLPEEAHLRALKEAEKLIHLPPMAPEVGIIRSYIDWIVELPWHEATEDCLDVQHAAAVLDDHHYGLPKAKERILEYIAVRGLKPKCNRQPILCFVGPPGIGKTSLGRSIAKALGRKFVRISLGGVRDEAEIRGHRRTYIGALPGRILQTMRRAGTVNPLFMLDEVDKLGIDYRGDPASALLEVLDPEQNHAFSDHYLELPYDLSQVMFITTANVTRTIPPALLDRMEVIEFPGYIEEEKIEIARRFLIPRQKEENGLKSVPLSFTEKALRRIIWEYTYEAGVRNLEREIARICRKVARKIAEGGDSPGRISAAMVEDFLGPPQHFSLGAEAKDEVGVATALAWTENGGELMPVEVLLVEGKGNLQITGQVGEVMQESAQAAITYLRSRAPKLQLDTEIFEQIDIHIHIPEGAIAKDGPSAGVTIATAVISAFTGRKVRKDVGMTGEITLRGNVLPVGGVREKVLAAHRAGLTTVIIPERNTRDLIELPAKAREEVQIVPVKHLDQVLEVALRPFKKRSGSKRRGDP